MAGDRRIYKTLWAIHSWTGLYVGLVVAILSVSGSAVVFQDEIDALLNPSLLRVAPSTERASLTAIADQIVARYGDGFSMNDMHLPESDEQALQVNLVSAGRAGTQIRQVLVNPHTGELLGDREYTKTFAYFLRHLHVRGFQARYGREFVGVFGIALLISTLTGFVIYGNFMRSMRFGQIRWTQGLRVIAADWHKAVGLTALLFNFIIALTGAWLGWSVDVFNVAKMPPDGGIQQMLAQVPRKMAPKQDAAARVDYDAVLASAKRGFPGFDPRTLNVTRDGRAQVILFGKPSSGLYASSADKVLVSKTDLAVTAAFDARTAGAASTLHYAAEPLHFGNFAGLWLKVLYGLFGLTAGILSISGFLVYWKRSEQRSAVPAMRSLTRWSVAISLAVALIATVSMTIGPLYPSLAITALSLLWPLWMAGRYAVHRWRTPKTAA